MFLKIFWFCFNHHPQFIFFGHGIVGKHWESASMQTALWSCTAAPVTMSMPMKTLLTQPFADITGSSKGGKITGTPISWLIVILLNRRKKTTQNECIKLWFMLKHRSSSLIKCTFSLQPNASPLSPPTSSFRCRTLCTWALLGRTLNYHSKIYKTKCNDWASQWGRVHKCQWKIGAFRVSLLSPGFKNVWLSCYCFLFWLSSTQ